MVPRPLLAPTQAMMFCTCADVIQPCPTQFEMNKHHGFPPFLPFLSPPPPPPVSSRDHEHKKYRNIEIYISFRIMREA